MSAPGEEPREKGSNPSFQWGLFGNIPAILILASVVLFVTGWSYLYGFYSAFGVSLDDLSFTIQEIMVFANQAIGSAVVLGAIITIVTLVLLVVFVRIVRMWAWGRLTGIQESAYKHPAIWVFAFLIAVMAVSFFSLGRGRKHALTEMLIGTSTLSQISIAVDPDMAPSALLIDAPKEGVIDGYRLLVHGKLGYFCFRPLEKVSASRPVNVGVLFIPDRCIRGVQIITAVPSGDIHEGGSQ